MELAPEHGYSDSEFLPDSHPWYLSLEWALMVEREKVTFEAMPLQPGGDSQTAHVLMPLTFAQSYIWPVFRHLAHLGM